MIPSLISEAKSRGYKGPGYIEIWGAKVLYRNEEEFLEILDTALKLLQEAFNKK